MSRWVAQAVRTRLQNRRLYRQVLALTGGPKRQALVAP